MRTISPAALALLRSTDPDLIRQVDAAAGQGRADSENTPLQIPFSHFEDNFMMLYAFLWYATTRRVPVIILPAPLRRTTRPQK